MIRVAIVDDHPATASGLATLLEREPDLQVAGIAGSLDESRRLLSPETTDVALVDVQLQGEPSGFEIVREASEHGGPAVILLSSYEYPVFHARALELGARGYLEKTASVAEILGAIRTVAAGGMAFSRVAIRDAMTAPRPPSDRELQVIRLVAAGHSNDEIGARLGLTEKSVESHLRRLFGRYGLASRTELTTAAITQGWVTLGDQRRE